MKLYGIKTCGSVKKALAFFKEHAIEVEFVDLRGSSFDPQWVIEWAKSVDVNTLYNAKGRTHKELGLAFKELTTEEKITLMQQKPLLIKRPVIVDARGIVVGFDEAFYRERFL
ncbi:MAG: hypothetical protein KU37_09420 [Sulfuricurvum sp. PC08-66]|nr:MAG: hypothetical protein KU37_09420 [Sulfuricurvum sp. PC08-66]